MKENCGIYQIINKLDGRVYIGSSNNLKSRKYRHFLLLNNNNHDNIYLQRSYNKVKSKYEEKNIKNYFIFEIIKRIEKYEDKEKLKEELLKWEQHYLDVFIIKGNIDKKRCYNLCPTVINKLGFRHTKETINKLRESHLGKKHTEETKQKMSISKSKENHPFYNKIFSEEHINKLRESHLGKKHTEETKQKMSKTHNKVKIINETTGEIFNSMREASRKYNINSGSICLCCKNKQKTAGGYIWKYLENMESVVN
jgi:group I intron endonuclease